MSGICRFAVEQPRGRLELRSIGAASPLSTLDIQADARRRFRRVALPHKIATLLYCFNEQGEVLLMERAQEPNLGLWSPCGGKLREGEGESPHACACREAFEEMGLQLEPRDLSLTGIVSEHGYQGQAHWLMFLFEVRRKLTTTPPPHREGRFQFFPPDALERLPLPETDREQIWPLFWKHRGGFFAAHCCAHPGGRNEWIMEESRPAPTAARVEEGN